MTPLAEPIASLSLRYEGKSCDDVDDRVLASLVMRRLHLQQQQGWVAFGLFATALVGLISGALIGPSELLLGIAGAGIATMAMGLGFAVERAAWWRFKDEARLCGLSEDATKRVFQRASGADEMIELLRACRREPSDAELASFVR